MLFNCPECNSQISQDALVCPKCGFRRYKPSEQDKQHRRNLAETETTNDLVKSDSHLLTDIHEESLDKTRPESETVSRTMSRFAALLVRLSRESAKTADKNLKLQRGAIVIAFIALAVAIISMVIQIMDKFRVTEDLIQIKYQRTYKGDDLKKFDGSHQLTNTNK